MNFWFKEGERLQNPQARQRSKGCACSATLGKREEKQERDGTETLTSVPKTLTRKVMPYLKE